MKTPPKAPVRKPLAPTSVMIKPKAPVAPLAPKAPPVKITAAIPKAPKAPPVALKPKLIKAHKPENIEDDFDADKLDTQVEASIIDVDQSEGVEDLDAIFGDPDDAPVLVPNPEEVELAKLPAPGIILKPLMHSEDDYKPVSDDYEEIARNLLASGLDEAVVAVKCNITLSRVFEIRRGQPAHTVMNRDAANNASKQAVQSIAMGEMPSPKKVFAARMSDFNECLEIAISEYKADPSSEINHHAMNGFMKTMKDLFESYQDLDDPQETAERLVKQVVYPYMSGMTKLIVDSFRDILDDVSPSLVSDFQKEQLKDGLKDGVRKIMESTRAEFNRAVKTLEVVYDARLESLYMKPQPGGANNSASALDTEEETTQSAQA